MNNPTNYFKSGLQKQLILRAWKTSYVLVFQDRLCQHGKNWLQLRFYKIKNKN